jgi:Ca-activated chloride channel family protein
MTSTNTTNTPGTNAAGRLTVLLSALRQGVAKGQDSVVDLLVRVQAPERPAELSGGRRHDLNIALVLDRSGSMRGAAIAEARKAAQFVVDHLEPGDRCGIVIYDNVAELLAPAAHVTDRNRLKDLIRTIETRGNTDLHQGWLVGAEALSPFPVERAISRVILLSDGNANAGVTDQATIEAQVARLAAAGVTTSTLGLGSDFNEGLMTLIARAGRGRAYYGETAEDLMAPFREEFDLLNAIVGRKVSCLLKPVTGVTMEVLNPYPRDAQGRIILPDVAWGSEAVIAVRLKVPAGLAAGASLVELLSASIAYTDLDGQVRGAASDPLMLPVMEAASLAALPADEMVVRRFAEMEVSLLQAEARLASRRGDWEAVERILTRMRAMAGDNAWVIGMLEQIADHARRRDAESFSKESAYAGDAMSSRLSGLNESYDMSAEARVARHLEKKLRHGRGRRPD